MTFFEDLTPYTYLDPEEEAPGTVNVGWLDGRHPFPTGRTSAEFRARLQQLCLRRVKRTRGFHACIFCKGRDKPHGSAEVRVAGRGRVYAAPELIHHYVVAHSYRPPEEFIAAVLAWDEGRAGPGATGGCRDMELDTKKIDEAVLALLYLGLHDGARAWKGFDWDALDRLHREGYITDPHGRAKSVVFTEEGLARSRSLVEIMFGKHHGPVVAPDGPRD